MYYSNSMYVIYPHIFGPLLVEMYAVSRVTSVVSEPVLTHVDDLNAVIHYTQMDCRINLSVRARQGRLLGGT